MKEAIISAVVAAVVAVGASALVPKTAPTLGALTGPDIPSSYLNWGGVRTWQYSQAMALASTTCSFQSPAATSTLTFAGARVSAAPLGTNQYEWGIGATAYATTTSLGRGLIGSGAQGTVLASTTNAHTGDNVDQETVLAPNTYVNLKVGTSTPTGQTGNCYARFTDLP